MIIKAQPPRATPRWLHGLLLVCAAALLPLGVAHAQDPDYDAVGRRLRQAVAAGELTGEQARAMFAALRQQAGAKTKVDPRSDADAIAMRKRLGAAVESGRITREEAREIFGKRMAARKKAQERQGAEKKPFTRADYARVEAKLKDAVAAGKISGEDARAKLRSLREKISAEGGGQRGGDRRRITREEYARAEARIKKAVADGEVPAEDARTRLREMRRMMGEQAGRGREESDGERRDLRREYADFERRIKAFVKSGRMSEAEAKKALDGFRRRLREARGRGRGDADRDR